MLFSDTVGFALFITCYNDTLFPEAGIAVVLVLKRLGHTVVFPAEQTCCGQMPTGAEICTACDTSCLMPIRGGLHRKGQRVQMMHVAEILAGTAETS
jgi:Fe-S oxidoreductase